MPKYIVFDRDGTLIKHIPYLFEPNKVELLPTVKESLKLFGKVTLRRGRGFIKAIGSMVMGIGKETIKFGVSVYNKEGYAHLKDRKGKIVKFVKEASNKSKDVSRNIYKLLKTNPKETL